MMRGQWAVVSLVVWASGCAGPAGCTTTHASHCSKDSQCGFVQVCEDGSCVDGPLGQALPGLPPVGGAAGASAHVLSDATDIPHGNAAQATPGDTVLRNRDALFVIQKPGRDIGPAPFGGNVIDAVPLVDGAPAPDEFGEALPLLNLGMTVDFNQVEIIRDGSAGGAAVVRAYGRPSLWDYVNLGGFLTEGLSTLIPFNPDEALPFRVVATYTLPPTGTVLNVRYTVLNESLSPRQLPVGLVVDSGGAVQPFRSGSGFGTPSYSAEGILGDSRPAPWFGYVGAQSSSAIRPLPVAGDVAADSQNPTVQVAGVTVSLFSRPDVLAALSESDFFLQAGGTGSFGFDLAVGGASLGEASAALLGAQGRATHTFSVLVRDVAGRPVEGALVLVRPVDTTQDTLMDAVAAGRTGVDGVVELTSPPGPRRVQVRAEGHASSDAVDVPEGGTNVDITVGNPGALRYRLSRADRVDTAVTAEGACRITVAGPPQWTDLALIKADNDSPRPGLAAVRYSATCNSDDDGAIPLQPGRYLVAVTAGPEFDAFQQLVDVGGDNPLVTGTLHRVVDGTGYVASDWHQHTVNSPDSPIPLQQRLLAYVAEGVGVFGGSDHDVVTDWETLVRQYGFEDHVQAINGVESTPFEYGHFNAFPLNVNFAKPSGGAVDWAGGTGDNLAPPQIWRAYRQLGAQVIQVNHPRGLGGTFQNYFDRAALAFDFDEANHTGAARGDVGAQPATNAQMRIPPLEPMWSADFDSVEIYNGFLFYPGALPGRRLGDRRADRILLDVSNLILVGHRPVMVGTSDTHQLKAGDTSYPRTYVRAGRDRAGKVDPWEVLGSMAGLGNSPSRGDVVVSNGPIPVVTASSDGRTVSPGGMLRAAGIITVEVDVQAPPWMSLHHAEVLVSPHALNGVDENNPLLPAAATADLSVPTVESLPNGGTRHRHHATLQVDLAQHNPFAGRDATLVVRVFGAQVMWPAVIQDISLTVQETASTAQDFLTLVNGASPYAVANPVYVDVNGDGRFKGAFEP